MLEYKSQHIASSLCILASLLSRFDIVPGVVNSITVGCMLTASVAVVFSISNWPFIVVSPVVLM